MRCTATLPKIECVQWCAGSTPARATARSLGSTTITNSAPKMPAGQARGRTGKSCYRPRLCSGPPRAYNVSCIPLSILTVANLVAYSFPALSKHCFLLLPCPQAMPWSCRQQPLPLADQAAATRAPPGQQTRCHHVRHATHMVCGPISTVSTAVASGPWRRSVPRLIMQQHCC